MPAKSIDQLPRSDALAGTEDIPTQVGGITKRTTPDAITNYMLASQAFQSVLNQLVSTDQATSDAFAAYTAAQQTVFNQIQAAQTVQTQTILSQADTINAQAKDIAALKSVILPNGSGALTLTAPTISGSTTVGSTVTFTSGTVGGGTAVTSTYTVKRGGVIVAGPQTGATYTIVPADGGSTITVTQTVTNAAGQQTLATSAGFTASAAPAVPAVITNPSITGSATVGQTLSGVHGTYTNGPITGYTYQWKNNSTVLGTGQTLSITQAMAGLSITFSEIPSNSTGPAVVAATSSAIIVSGGATPVNTTAPGWADGSNFTVGGVLKFDPGIWTNNPDSSLDVYGILRDGVAISVSISPTNPIYTCVSADQDKTLTPTLIRRNSGSSPSALAQGAGEYIDAAVGGGGSSPTPTSNFGTLSATTFDTSTAGPNGYLLTPSLTGTVSKAGGYNISYAALGGSLATDTSIATPTINFTGGTPTASGSTTTGLLSIWGGLNSGIQFTVDIPAGSSTVYAPVIAFGVVDLVTASLADGSAGSVTFSVDPGAANVDTRKLVAIPVTAGAATQMIVKIEQKTFYTAGQGNSHLCGIWV